MMASHVFKIISGQDSERVKNKMCKIFYKRKDETLQSHVI